MKYCLNFIFCSISLFLISCGDDNSTTCTPSDWLGTYVGSEECNDDPADNATIVITSSGESLIMEISNPSTTVTTSEISINGCSISDNVNIGGTATLELDASLNTDEITINTNFFGSQCTYSATRM